MVRKANISWVWMEIRKNIKLKLESQQSNIVLSFLLFPMDARLEIECLREMDMNGIEWQTGHQWIFTLWIFDTAVDRQPFYSRLFLSFLFFIYLFYIYDHISLLILNGQISSDCFIATDLWWIAVLNQNVSFTVSLSTFSRHCAVMYMPVSRHTATQIAGFQPPSLI